MIRRFLDTWNDDAAETTEGWTLWAKFWTFWDIASPDMNGSVHLGRTNLRTARIYLLWGKPDSNGQCPLYYCGSSRQTRKQRFYGHKRAARCDPLKSPLHRFAHNENETDPMSGWTCTQL
jgi:hypothetical protein